MNILFNNQIGVVNSVAAPSYSNNSFASVRMKSPLSCDVFEKSLENIAFTSKKQKNVQNDNKRIERILRNIDGLHDPYSGILMITEEKINNLKQKIDKRPNAEAMINLLNNYTEHMFAPEEKVFDMFKEDLEEAKKNKTPIKNLSFEDFINNHIVDAKKNLVAEQLDVLGNMKAIAKEKLSKDDYKIVKLTINKIEEKVYDDGFRIRTSKDDLKKLYPKISDKKLIDEIIKMTDDFPSSSTSADAFIVNNQNKSHKEIALALVSPAQTSIEHIKPESHGGASSPENYIVASRRMNGLRGTMPYSEFIEKYPNIPKYAQLYFNDLIRKVQRGGLKKVVLSLLDVKQTLYKESSGLINVDLSRLDPNVYKEFDKHKEKNQALVMKFKSFSH